MAPTNNDWNEYKRLVLNELQELNDAIHKLNDKVDGLHTDMAELKVKAGLWGALSGAVVTIGALLLSLLKKGL